MSINNDDSLSLTTFISGQKCLRLEFINNEVRWDNARPPYAQNIIPTRNIIAVKYNKIKEHIPNKIKKNPYSFTIYHVEQKKKNKWSPRALILHHSEEYQILLWTDTLQQHLLTNFHNRPKNLLLFINPYGGKKRGLKIYEKYSKHLFELAEVNVTIFVSQKQNQIRDKLIGDNLDNFDSIGCIGGDGTVSEVINGLVLRECREREVNENDGDVVLPSPSLPVGIIPGGSTDTTTYCLHGTTDVTTAVLQIILGDTLGLDLVSVHDSNGFLRVYADVTSYGFLGDIAYHSEKLRWMGPSRYEYSGFRKLMANTAYSGEISILKDDTEHMLGLKCYQNCQQCSLEQPKLSENQSVEEETEKKWKTLKGKFFMISGANMSCAGERNPHGLAPYCHLGDGFLHLLVIYHTSVFYSLLTLNRFTKSSYTTDDLRHVEMYRTKEFYFRSGSNHSRWNCDGEIMEQTDIHARVHRQLLTVFGRGFNPPAKNKRRSA